MKLRDVTKDAMVSALRAVQLYSTGELDENMEWDDVLDLVNTAVTEYTKDAERPEGAQTFDGATYNPALDENRLRSLLGRVFDAMSEGRWRTLASLVGSCGGTVASVSARLRDLKKAKFGAWIVDKRRVKDHPGLWEYRLRNPDGTELPPLRPDALSQEGDG